MIAPFPSPVKEWHNDTYASIDPKRPELSAKGKKIVITGGGYGIGRGTAIAFAEAGAAGIAILGRKEAPLLETKEFIENKYNIPVTTHVADVTDESAVKKAAQKIGEWHVLDMNAGYFSAPATALEISADEWWKSFEVYLPFSPRSLMQFLMVPDQRKRFLHNSSSLPSHPRPKLHPHWCFHGRRNPSCSNACPSVLIRRLKIRITQSYGNPSR